MIIEFRGLITDRQNKDHLISISTVLKNTM